MSRFEIKGLFRLPSGRHLPCGLNIFEKLWWQFMPGVVINVRWPVGEIRIKQEESNIWDYVRSADPNDHYRPWLEKNVGKQGRDWNWGMANNDASENRLTIKIRKSKSNYAVIALLRWN
jgi:hypothetical protein